MPSPDLQARHVALLAECAYIGKNLNITNIRADPMTPAEFEMKLDRTSDGVW